MSDLTLVIGNKKYSSWSLRPWLALRNAGIPFDERLLLLFDENWRDQHLIPPDVEIWEYNLEEETILTHCHLI